MKRLAALCFVVASALILWRVHALGPQGYGVGAEYIEHAFRLQCLRHVRESGGLEPWRFLIAHDAGYPALLPLIGVVAGGVVGHSIEDLAPLGLLWVALLGAGVGLSAGAWTGSRRAGWLAGALTVSLPVVSAVATRFYYDLPVAAAIWGMLAALLVVAPRRPALGILLAAVAFTAGGLLKWTALPFGVIALAATARDRRTAGWALAVALLGGAALGGFFVASGGNSFGSMTRGMLPSVEVEAVAQHGGAWSGELLVRAITRPLRQIAEVWSVRFLLWYPLAFIVALLSPAVTLAMAPLAWRGLARTPELRRASAVYGVGTVALLAGWIHVQDERFLLGLAPLVPVAVAAGWSSLESDRARRGWLAAILLVCAAVGVDFHVRRGEPGPARRLMTVEYRGTYLEARGLGLPSSQHGIGWMRGDEQRDARRAYREAVWAAVRRSGARTVGTLRGRPLFSPEGDDHWLSYRARYAALEEGSAGVQVKGSEGVEVVVEPPSDLLLVRAGDIDAQGTGDRWVLWTRVAAEDGGPEVELWRRAEVELGRKREPGTRGSGLRGPEREGGDARRGGRGLGTRLAE